MALVSVELDADTRVAVVTLNDPGRRNALTLPMVEDLVEAFGRFERDEQVGAVVVTGEPPAFCAGADLSDLLSSSAEATGKREASLRAIYEGFVCVARSPLPTVAAVNGAAVGAGMNLALVCDLRLAGEGARFDSRFLQLGIHPGGGHTWMLRRAAGPQTVAATVLFGEVLDGREAERLGVVHRCVPDDELASTARALAARAAVAPRELAARAKRTIADMATVESHDGAVDRELQDQLWSLEQPAFRERLAGRRAK